MASDVTREELEDLERRFREFEARRGDVIDIADPALALSRDLIDLGEVPSCGIHKTSDLAIVTATWTKVTFGSVTWDTDQMADVSNNGITIRRAGIYSVTCLIRWSVNAIGIRCMRVFVNDTIYFTGQTINSHATIHPLLSASAPRYLEIGDTLTAEVYHNKGSNTNILGSTATEPGSQLTATLIADAGDIRTEMA